MENPSGKPHGSDCGLNKQGVCALGEACRQRGGGCELAKEGHPDSRIPRVLIGQDADSPSLLEHGHGSLHLFLAVEGDNPATTSIPVDQIIHEGVAERLINTTRRAGFDGFPDLGADLPVARVAESDHGALLTGLFPDDPVDPVLFLLHAESGTKLLDAHGRNLDRADDIGPEIQKMSQGDPGGFLVGQRGTEGDLEILFGETAVAGQNHPNQKPDCLSQDETDRDGEQSDKGDNR